MQGWVKATRVIALVNKGATYALVIFLISRTPPQVYSDLTIERVLPIDQDFKCDIGNYKYNKTFYLPIQCKRDLPYYRKFSKLYLTLIRPEISFCILNQYIPYSLYNREHVYCIVYGFTVFYIYFYYSLKETDNKYLSYYLDTGGKQQEGLYVYLNIAFRKLRLIFEMKRGTSTSSLVSEIFRAIEGNILFIFWKENIF